jgi:hypothetical protein
VTVSQWGGGTWKDGFYPVKSQSITVPQPSDVKKEYSNYPPGESSEIVDPFFGVDFSAGVYGIDILPSTGAGNVAIHPTETNHNQQELGQDGSGRADPRNEDGSWTGGLAPEQRERINDLEYPSFKEQEQHRRLNDKNDEVEDWKSQIGPGIGGHGQSSYS